MSRFSIYPLLVLGLVSSPSLAANATPHTGFPVAVTGGGWVRFGKPLVVDLDNNGGAKEIVVGTCNDPTDNGDCDGGRKLYVFDNAGNIRAGWPQSLPSEPASTPTAGNLDGSGALEIVVGSGSAVLGEGNGRLTAFHADGSLVWSAGVFSPSDNSIPPDSLPDPVNSTPALGDLDGDGKDDVVFGSFDSRVYALKGTNGSLLPGWPIFVRDTVWASAALADLDGDGKLEIVIGADSHFEGSPINTPSGGALWVFRANGSNFPGFPVFAPTSPDIVGFHSSPAVGDIDGDGCPEIVIGTGGSTSTAGKLLHAWHRDGTPVTGWPVTMGGHPSASPALANLDADAALEVVETDDTANLYAFNGNGTQIFKMKPKDSAGNSAVVLGEPIVALSGSDPVILTGGVNWEVTLVSKTGTQISNNGTNGGLTYNTGRPVAGPAVADLDSDNTLEVVAASAKANSGSSSDLGVFAWPITPPSAPTAVQPWPQFRQGTLHRGTAPGTTGCAVPKPALRFYTLTPCRIADSRQSANLTYGGPIYSAGEKRVITFAGVCGVPLGAMAASINVTVTGANVPGYLTLYPAGDGTPTATTINFRAGQTRANNAVLALSFDGRGQLTVENGGAGLVHVIIDVNGYYQ